jgi:hypothetical protein
MPNDPNSIGDAAAWTGLRMRCQAMLDTRQIQLTRETIRLGINDYYWQCLRQNLVGKDLDVIHRSLTNYLNDEPKDVQRCVRVLNHINGLRRARRI